MCSDVPAGKLASTAEIFELRAANSKRTPKPHWPEDMSPDAEPTAAKPVNQ
jgi:hypothetical protein